MRRKLVQFHNTDSGRIGGIDLTPSIAYFEELYAYNDWANDRAFGAVQSLSQELLARDLGNSFASLLDTFVHLVGAEWIWLERWHGRWPPALPKTSEFGDFAGVRARAEHVRSDREKWLSSLGEEDLRKDLRYLNLRGEFYSYPLWQQLAHVANHSTYHRGQVTTMLRQLGMAAVSTDFLLYCDELNEQRRSASAG